MQTWWVFYIYLLFNYLSSIKYVFPSLFLIISFGHQQIKIRNHKIRLFILLISNKQGHTLAYIHIHTHLLLFFVSFTPKLVYLIFLFIILSIWKWECCVGYILMVWHIFCGNQIGKSKHRCLICVFLMILLVKCVVYYISSFQKLGKYHFPPHFDAKDKHFQIKFTHQMFFAAKQKLLFQLKSKPTTTTTTTIQTNPATCRR